MRNYSGPTATCSVIFSWEIGHCFGRLQASFVFYYKIQLLTVIIALAFDDLVFEFIIFYQIYVYASWEIIVVHFPPAFDLKFTHAWSRGVCIVYAFPFIFFPENAKGMPFNLSFRRLFLSLSLIYLSSMYTLPHDVGGVM